jgi:hypothetical protein
MCYRNDMLQAAVLPFARSPLTPKQSARRLSR